VESTTPRGGSSAKRTPRRDQLNINSESTADFGDEPADVAEQLKQLDITKALQEGLAKLPKPREYKVAMPELPEDEDMEDQKEEDESRVGTSKSIVDAEDIERINMEKKRAKEEEKLKLRSQSLRRGLPRPFKLNPTFAKSNKEIEAMTPKVEGDKDIAAELIKAEMFNMMYHDALEYPSKLVQPPDNIEVASPYYTTYKPEETNAANKLLKNEVNEIKKVTGDFSFEEYEEIWKHCYQDLIYLPHVKKFSLYSMNKSEADKIRAIQFQYDSVNQDLQRQIKKSQNIEKPLQLYLGGYERVAANKEENIHILQKKIAQSRIEKYCFSKMREMELKAIKTRLEKLKAEVAQQQETENQLQLRYANLVKQKNELIELTQSKLVQTNNDAMEITA